MSLSEFKNAIGVFLVFVGLIVVMGADSPELTNLQILAHGLGGIILLIIGFKVSVKNGKTNS